MNFRENDDGSCKIFIIDLYVITIIQKSKKFGLKFLMKWLLQTCTDFKKIITKCYPFYNSYV